jgi:quinol monooxygenase YgiN
VPITVLADMRFKPEATDEGVQALGAILPDTRAFDGCLRVDVVQDQADKGHVILIEEWAAPENHKAYMAWRKESGSSAGMRDALAQLPAITYLDQRTDI